MIPFLFGLADVQTPRAELPYERESDRIPALRTGGSVLLRGGRVLTITQGVIEGGDVLIRDGKIAAVGRNLAAPEGVSVVDVAGKVVMPGIVDTHSHRGLDGVNEGSDSVTPEASVRWVVNPEARNVWQALASGHTTALLLHGSANTIGGESVVVKYKYGTTPDAMIVPDAPRMVKFALGENVTRKGDDEGRRFPRSRMGVEATLRRAFAAARDYRARQAKGEKVRYDLRLETLADILDRKVWVQCHSYRSDEMLMLVRLSQEYGFKVGAMQHALEAYKIAPELAQAGVGVGMFADHWGYKQEAYDAIPWNAWICWKRGVNVSINTDGTSGTTALNLDAAKVMRYGAVPEAEALKMITINPARQLGVDQRVGSLEVGKDGDVSVWDGHPFSPAAKPVMTFVEGEAYFVRRDAFGVDGRVRAAATLPSYRYEPTPALPPVSRVYAIVGGTVHPVSGPAIPNGTVVVRDGRIAAVGRNVAVPRGAVRIEARGRHVYPGFVDAGNSMGIQEIAGIPQLTDTNELGDAQPDLDVRTALWPESQYYATARLNGVTTSLSRSVSGIIPGRACLVQHDGKTSEELGFGPNAAMMVSFPSVITYRDLEVDAMCCALESWSSIGRSWLDGRVPTHLHDEDLAGYVVQPAEVPARIKELQGRFDAAREYLKGSRLPRDEKYEAMAPYLAGERPFVLRVRNAATIRAAVDFAKKNGIKVILSGAADAWKEADLLAREGIPVTIEPAGESTLGANAPLNDWDPYDAPYVNPAILADKGVRFAFESALNAESQNLPYRVGTHLAYGLSHERAIRALTLDAATILGMEKERGSLEVGKVADLMVVDGDPLSLQSQVKVLFVGGRPVPLVSKFTALRDKYEGR